MTGTRRQKPWEIATRGYTAGMGLAQDPWPPRSAACLAQESFLALTAHASYRDILDDLLHQDGVGQHVRPEGCVLQQQAQQLAHHRQLLGCSSVHPQALQHQSEDSRQQSQDRDTDPPQLVPATTQAEESQPNTHRESTLSRFPKTENVLLRNMVFSDKTPKTKTRRTGFHQSSISKSNEELAALPNLMGSGKPSN